MSTPCRPRNHCLILAGCVLVAVRGSNAEEPPPLVHEGMVAAPVARVWTAFTTRAGLEGWMAPHADLELRIGGLMRANYKKDGTLEDAEVVKNTILAFEPGRMISIKATGVPASFPFKQAIERMWTVIYFEPVGMDRTRVRIVSMGFGDDEESRQMRDFFEQGNALTLRKLQAHFPLLATQPAGEALALARRLIGGEWHHERQFNDGTVFRALVICSDGPDGASFLDQGWLGDAEGMFHHGMSLVWREPATGRVLFQNISEAGAVARGEVRVIGPQKLEWEWNVTSLAGRPSEYLVHIEFDGPDAYQMQLLARRDNEWVQSVDARFVRAASAPEAFKKPRKPAPPATRAPTK